METPVQISGNGLYLWEQHIVCFKIRSSEVKLSGFTSLPWASLLSILGRLTLNVPVFHLYDKNGT